MVPKAITAHGWLLFEESKMSKSRGNIVRTETILDAFGTLKPRPIDLPGAVLSDEYWKHQQDLFAADILRYFLLREIPFGADGSFSFDGLVQRYNSDLVNGYGNLVSRTLSMIYKYFGGAIPETPTDPSLVEIAQGWIAVSTAIPEAHGYSFTKILEELARQAKSIDETLTRRAPWKIASIAATGDTTAQAELVEILYTAAEFIRVQTALLYPFLPYATAQVWSQLGLGDIEQAATRGELKDLQWGGLKPGTKLGQLAPIFPRAPKELIEIMANMENPNTHPDSTVALPHITNNSDASAHPKTEFRETPISSLAATPSLNAPAEHLHSISEHHAKPAPAAHEPAQAAHIAIDDFAKIDLRVAQIVAAERIPKADKLLRLEVDLGSEKRQILSGIAEWYTPEELLGKKIVVIANLAPRKMRGLESHGMLLAASAGENGKPILATFGEDIALGSRLK
jgi:methionyl-tRNA synthetase